MLRRCAAECHGRWYISPFRPRQPRTETVCTWEVVTCANESTESQTGDSAGAALAFYLSDARVGLLGSVD